VKRIGTLPGYPFTYTLVPAYPKFACLPGGKRSEDAWWCNGITHTPLTRIN